MGVTVRQRSGSWNVFWPLGGGRSAAGKTQSTTWPDETIARQAAAIVKARQQSITKQELEDLILAPVELPPEAASPCPLLRDWVADWLPSKTRTSPGTVAGYEQMLNARILPFQVRARALGDWPMDLITGMDIAHLVHDLRTRPTRQRPNGLREGTVTRYFAVLHAAYTAAIRARATTHVTLNPCDETDFVRDAVAHDDDGSGDNPPVYLTPVEYRLLRDQFHPHYHPLLDVLAGTGARWSEATAFAVAAVDLEPRRGGPPVVNIVRAWKKGTTGRYLGTTKGKRKRAVPVPGWLLPVAKQLVDGRSPKAFLLTTPGEKPYDYANFYHQVWCPAVLRAMRCPQHPPPDCGQPVPEGVPDRGARCGDWGGVREEVGKPARPCGAKRLPGVDRCRWHAGPQPGVVSSCDCPTRLRERVTPHDLRHSYASWFLAGGGDMRVLQELLGHESITTTEIYSGLQPGSVDAAASILDTMWQT